MSQREAKVKVVAVVEKEEKKRGEKWKKKVCCVSARTTASLVSFCLGKLRWDKMWHAGVTQRLVLTCIDLLFKRLTRSNRTCFFSTTPTTTKFSDNFFILQT